MRAIRDACLSTRLPVGHRADRPYDRPRFVTPSHPAETPASRSASAPAPGAFAPHHPPRFGWSAAHRTPYTCGSAPTPRRPAPRSRWAPSAARTDIAGPPAHHPGASTTGSAGSDSGGWFPTPRRARPGHSECTKSPGRRGETCVTLEVDLVEPGAGVGAGRAGRHQPRRTQPHRPPTQVSQKAEDTSVEFGGPRLVSTSAPQRGIPHSGPSRHDSTRPGTGKQPPSGVAGRDFRQWRT